MSEWISIKDTYDRLLKLIGSENFLKMQGLGNEVPFFICPFPVCENVEVAEMRRQLVNTLAPRGIQVLEVDLYDLCVEVLKENGDWDYYIENEAKLRKDRLKEELQAMLDAEKVLIPAIARRMEAAHFDVLFISGVGEVYPFIRSHNVLNNLQSTARNHPTLMFFPGKYTYSPESGTSLNLFGRLPNDKYYRAFNVFACEV